MEWLSHLLAPLAAYPRWLVILCAALVVVGVGWLLGKLLKWAFYLVILVVLLGLVVGVVAWLLG